MGAARRSDGGKASLRDAAGMQLDAFDAVWRSQSWLFVLEANKLQSRRRHAGKSSSAVRIKAIVRSLRNLLHGKTWGMLENASRIPLEPHSNRFNSRQPPHLCNLRAKPTRATHTHCISNAVSSSRPILLQQLHASALAALRVARSPRSCGRAHVQYVSAHSPTRFYASPAAREIRCRTPMVWLGGCMIPMK